ncbi:hypothetical protein BG015_009548 [Linnemannia schmuckeri]|uniref:C3H1-type domain-containing protein n=1 Tax=Linnemannia schmuckeri TaxID=64567 RepID=A0A9P5RVD4_9FUNG|nr:hypothetical protein BG015_009548 [Linnemannia schmuckeri]
MDYFGNHPFNQHHQHHNQQHPPHIIPRTATTLRQYPPSRLILVAPYPVAVPEISTRLIGATKPLNSELGTPSFLSDTTMELGSGVSVLFSVNPPSPVESELCSDDHETIVRTWCTAGPSTEQLLGEDRAQAVSSSCDITQAGSATTAATSSASAANQNGDPSSKKGTRGPRRGSSENNKKAELYKTELCISVHSGLVCKYGDNCQFAHSVAELQHVNRHPRYKTQLCTSFQSQGFCKYNDRCTFIHHPEEARVPLSPSLFRKTPAAAPLPPNQSPPVPAQVPNQIPTQVLGQFPHQMLAQMLSNHQNQNCTAPTSTSHPTSGTATPAQQLADYSKMDRARAMSDPCISTYMDGPSELRLPPRMDGLKQGFFYAEPMGMSMSMAMDMTNPATAQYPQQVFASPLSNDPHEFMHQGPLQQPMPLPMRRQRRMGISYPPPGFPSDGGHPVQHRDIFDLLPHYNEYGMFDPDLAAAAAAVRPTGTLRPPWMAPISIWQPLHNNMTPSNNNNPDENQYQIQSQSQGQNQSQPIPGPQQQGGPVEAECDAEWIAKLGHYITTSQNDFEI